MLYNGFVSSTNRFHLKPSYLWLNTCETETFSLFDRKVHCNNQSDKMFQPVLPFRLGKGRSACLTQRKSLTGKPSFHKRTLPAHLEALSSRRGKVLFREALSLGGMESYFGLSEQFLTQSEPAYCALSSLAMVMNALNHDPKKIWKGVWRWVTEDTLQCEKHRECGHQCVHQCGHSLEKVKKNGMNFDEFESLAQCHGIMAESFRAPLADANENYTSNCNSTNITRRRDHDLTMEDFRWHVMKASMCDEAQKFIIVNFSRKYLGQTGDGHFSPIGGYHPDKDLVLILDTARFKYPPFWVPLTELWESMRVVDVASGGSRGYFVVNSSTQSCDAKSGHSCKETVHEVKENLHMYEIPIIENEKHEQILALAENSSSGYSSTSDTVQQLMQGQVHTQILQQQPSNCIRSCCYGIDYTKKSPQNALRSDERRLQHASLNSFGSLRKTVRVTFHGNDSQSNAKRQAYF